jgi:hypothetical protein
VNRPDGDDRGSARVESARDNGLEGSDDRGSGDNRVDTFVGARAMRSLADDIYREGISSGSKRSRLRYDLPDRESPVNVTAENRADTIERAALDDCRRTIPHFLGRLQHDEDVATSRRSREQHSGAHRPRSVHVVTACVHNAGDGGGKRQSRGFLDRQCIDVTTQCHDRRTTIHAWNASDDTGSRDASDLADPGFS